MRILSLLILLMSFRAEALNCSNLLGLNGTENTDVLLALVESELLYSLEFSGAVSDTIRIVSSKGVYNSVMTDVLKSGNLSDLEPLAEAIYQNMNNMRFASPDARSLYKSMDADLVKSYIVDALLLNAKYKERVSAKRHGRYYEIKERAEMATELGVKMALPIWLGSISLSYMTNSLDVLIGGGVLAGASLATGALGLYADINSDKIADKSNARFKKKVLKDLSSIRNKAYRGQPTPVLMLAIDEAFSSGELDRPAHQVPLPIPSILW